MCEVQQKNPPSGEKEKIAEQLFEVQKVWILETGFLIESDSLKLLQDTCDENSNFSFIFVI